MPKLDQGKLVFSRTAHVPIQHEFRRAQSILYDLKSVESIHLHLHSLFLAVRYLLGVVPDQYSNELRENFINGYQAFLRLLVYMHVSDRRER